MAVPSHSRKPWIAVTVVSLALLASGLLIGLMPVGGTFDSESFTCGSSFLATDGTGYEGTEQYAACDRERSHLRWIASANVALGAVLLGAVSAGARRRSQDQDGHRLTPGAAPR
jgi:hypothetical protein